MDENEELLRAFELSARRELPAGLPAVDFQVAVWAAERLAEICRLTVARTAGPYEFAPAFAVPCPAGESPVTDFSADLFLRHLPLLSSFTERLAPGDPLLAGLLSFSAAWPLSSVGMKLAAPPAEERVAKFVETPAILRLYVDRILATADLSRLEASMVRRAIRDTLGSHPELAPEVARALEQLAGTVPFQP